MCSDRLQHGCNQATPTSHCWSEKSDTLSKLLTMWKHSLLLDGQSSKNYLRWLSVRSIVPHLTLLKVTFLHNVRCPHMFISRHRHSLSCLLPFMLRAPQVDLSLLVCALEDSWTSSFLYKSPSERDSGDSTSLRLVTRAINTIWDQDLSSHFPG